MKLKFKLLIEKINYSYQINYKANKLMIDFLQSLDQISEMITIINIITILFAYF
jgi:hypothetical protein